MANMNSKVSTAIRSHLLNGGIVIVNGQGAYALADGPSANYFFNLPVWEVGDFGKAPVIYVGGAHGACSECDEMSCQCEPD